MTLKYPWLAPDSSDAATALSLNGASPAKAAGKYGADGDDAVVFDWIREGAPADTPCLEAQVMDWADDVAYSVHDLEDGLHAGLITMAALRDPAEREAVAKLTVTEYCEPGSVTVAELDEVFSQLLGLDCWPAGFDGGPQS